MIDSGVFVPWIERALRNAQAPGALPALAALAADPRLAGTVDRIADWDLRTRTGIAGGYDVGRPVGSQPSGSHIADSVATTIYSVWRSQFVRNTIDAPLTAQHLATPEGGLALTALRHLLDTFSVSGGVGASGLNFFNVPGVTSATDRRDIVILKSLSDALTRLASPDFAPAFGGSADQPGRLSLGETAPDRLRASARWHVQHFRPPAMYSLLQLLAYRASQPMAGSRCWTGRTARCVLTVRTASCSTPVRPIEASTWRRSTA